MVKRNGKCVSRLSLTASALVMRPSQPAAGQQFAVGATILNQKTKKGLPSAAVSCPAVLKGKPVAVRQDVLRRPALGGLLLLDDPRLGAGSMLQGAVVATYQGAHVRRWLQTRVG